MTHEQALHGALFLRSRRVGHDLICFCAAASFFYSYYYAGGEAPAGGLTVSVPHQSRPLCPSRIKVAHYVRPASKSPTMSVPHQSCRQNLLCPSRIKVVDRNF